MQLWRIATCLGTEQNAWSYAWREEIYSTYAPQLATGQAKPRKDIYGSSDFLKLIIWVSQHPVVVIRLWPTASVVTRDIGSIFPFKNGNPVYMANTSDKRSVALDACRITAWYDSRASDNLLLW